MMIHNDLLHEKLGTKVKGHVLLAPYTTFRIGGPADYFLEAHTQEEMINSVIFARDHSLPFFILGGGSNIIIGDKGFRGLVIHNCSHAISIKGIKGTISAGVKTGKVYVEADSGVSFNLLVRSTIEEGLRGLEMHLGLPGTVGGAISMNSKWMNPPSYVQDVLYQAKVFTPVNEIRTVPKEQIEKLQDIILSVVFELHHADKTMLWEIANKNIAYRKETQPQGVKTAGCVFKNITPAEAIIAQTPHHTTSTGYLIDHAGCKNLEIGGAKVSPIHANFIVNTGNATAADVLQLIHLIQEKVQKQFGVMLKEEVIRIGEF